jgi:LysR family transcriptional regulator, transcriptional activator for aaeXAB operon
MDTLHWPLSVLSRAVHFKNLTGASAHVGLSQPQLSRLVAQLEKEFDVSLLDRSAKRKSAWTPAAFRLAEVYAQNSRKLQSSIQEILVAHVPTHIHIGILEGLSTLAIDTIQKLYKQTKLQIVELDVFDQNELEERFFNNDLDVIFTARSPGKQKFKHALEVGYQNLDNISSNTDYAVLSSFEYGRLKKKPENKTLISNSLSIRRSWFEKFGGAGQLPSAIHKNRSRDTMGVMIIAGETFNESLWQVIAQHAPTI